jgi:hypothetical protein
MSNHTAAEDAARLTNEVCEKVDAGHYLIDGQAIDFPVIVADASMLMNAYLVDAAVAQDIIRAAPSVTSSTVCW